MHTKGKGRIAAFSQRGRRGRKWGDYCVMEGQRGEVQWFPSGGECRERTTNSTNSFVPPDGGHVFCIVTSNC